MRRIALLLLVATVIPVWAQESDLGAAFRKEGDAFDQDCKAFKIADCSRNCCLPGIRCISPSAASLLVTDLAAALPSLPIQTPNENWRLFWNADAVGTFNGSWRAGGYMTAVVIRHPKITMGMGTAGKKPSSLTLLEMPVIHAYVQATSLNSIAFYGLGPETSATHSYFGMTETIAGANVVWPLFKTLNVSLLGEANGRFFGIRGEDANKGLSIEQTSNNGNAPGLADQPGFAQFGEGIRLRPSFANGHVRLSYTANFQEWIASNSTYSFPAFDCGSGASVPALQQHTLLIARETSTGPDTCAQDANSLGCPPISRNLEGSFNFRVLLYGFLRFSRQCGALLCGPHHRAARM